MELLKIVAVGIITAFCSLILRDGKSSLSVSVGIAGGCIIMLMVLDCFADVFASIKNLVESVGLSVGVIKSILKIIGIGYVTEFSAGIIEDAGLHSVSEKVVMAGKIMILVVALPIITSLFDLVAELIG